MASPRTLQGAQVTEVPWPADGPVREDYPMTDAASVTHRMPHMGPSLCAHAYAMGSRVVSMTGSWTRDMVVVVVEEEEEEEEEEEDGARNENDHYHHDHHHHNNNHHQHNNNNTEVPDPIQSLASHPEGSLLAVATRSGRVSVLRGDDGSLRSTHQVRVGPGPNPPEDEHSSPIVMAWLPVLANERSSGMTQDAVLWIEGPPDASRTNDTNQPAWQQYLLVRPVEDAAVSLSTIALPSADWRASAAYVGTLQRSEGEDCRSFLRVVACRDDGCLAAYQHDLEPTDNNTLGQEQGRWQPSPADPDWNVDYEVGLRLHTFRDRIYVLVVGMTSSSTTLYWVDPFAMETACTLQLSSTTNIRPHTTATTTHTSRPTKRQNPLRPANRIARPKVLAMEPLLSSPKEESLAVAVAVQSPLATDIQVIRVLVEETFGLTLLSKPHVLYRVPVVGTVPALLELAPNVSRAEPYAFVYRAWGDHALSLAPCLAFQPGDTVQPVGQLHRLLVTERFNELAQELAHPEVAQVLEDPLVALTAAEVAHQRWRFLLSRGCWRNASDIALARECLQQLVSNAMAGAVDYLMQATDLGIHSLTNPTLAEMNIVLQTLDTALQQVMANAPDTAQLWDVVHAKHQELGERLKVLQFLESIVPSESAGRTMTLTKEMQMVRSPRQLFSLLMEQEYFVAAERLSRSELRHSLTPEVLVVSLLRIPTSVHPKKYMHILTEVVLPSISIGHELLGPVRSWVCRTADALDESENHEGLADAILLLERTLQSLNQLQLQVHESFAISSPFRCLDKGLFVKRVRHKSSLNASCLQSSLDESVCVTPPETEASGETYRSTGGGLYPSPTFLQLGVLDRGAIKSRVGSLVPTDTRYDNDKECVASKLREAQCLQRARLAGLGKEVATLKTLLEKGGPQFIALKLVGLLARASDEHTVRFELMSKYLQPFCDEFGIDYDSAVHQYIEARCRGRNLSRNAIQEAGSLARCCQSVERKSKTTLIVLQSALRCGYFDGWLFDLAKDAKKWASFDSDLQSQVQEASRLLSISSILVKYCGSRAREMFKIDNPRHAVRLMDHVVQHIHYETVLDDVLALCDAFIHLNVSDSFGSLIQYAIIQGNDTVCERIMTCLCERDVRLAENVLVKTITYVNEILSECSEELRQTSTMSNEQQAFSRLRGTNSCRCVCVVVDVMLRYTRSLSPAAAMELIALSDDGSITKLRDQLHTVRRLQTDFSVFMSFSDMRSSATITRMTADLLVTCLHNMKSKQLDSLSDEISIAKRACHLLSGPGTRESADIWINVCADAAVKLVRLRQEKMAFLLLDSAGLLEHAPSSSLSHAQLSIAYSLMTAVEQQESSDTIENLTRLVKAAILARSYSITSSKNEHLVAASSLSSILDNICEILSRCDAGVGETLQKLRASTESNVWETRLPPSMRMLTASSNASRDGRPLLRNDWYIGDGLLLPPDEATSLSTMYGKERLLCDFSSIRFENEFLRNNGAHFLALRLLCCSGALFASNPTNNGCKTCVEDLDLRDTLSALAERSLGGSCHSGMTSSVVDSELAAAYMLALPLKEAIEAYKASIPTAIMTRNFGRVFALANVGTVVCLVDNDPNKSLGGFFAIGWPARDRFSVPCQELSLRARWWSALAGFNVEFDCQSFEVSKGKLNKTYIRSLLPEFIKGLSSKLDIPIVFKACYAFAAAFSIAKTDVLCEFIRFLLTADESAMARDDLRSNIGTCAKLAKRTLSMISHTQARCDVLRECLCHCERTTSMYLQYERFSLILSLYHDALESVLEHEPITSSCDLARFECDFEKVCRRRDALSILSSLFSRDRTEVRPPFPEFFTPLDTPDECQLPFCGILGKQHGHDCNVFDPLEPLNVVFSNPTDTAPVVSLGPLSLSVGLPAGYIHARQLIWKFVGGSCPSFENDVAVTVERIRNNTDRVVLLEWCADQYRDSEENRLKCLEMAHSAAIKASNEIETRRRDAVQDPQLEQAESAALLTLKRIDSARSAISDRLRVRSILIAATSSRGITSRFLQDLIQNLDKKVHEDSTLSADALVHFLLINASDVVSEACLCEKTPLSVEQFRHFRSIVNEACQSIAEQYSHINLLNLCSQLARRWLFYGDESDTNIHRNDCLGEKIVSQSNDNDTLDFGMNLSDLLTIDQQDSCKTTNAPDEPAKSFTSDEERSAILPLSAREKSEAASRKEALRIAFVLSFQEDAVPLSSADGTENRAPTVSDNNYEDRKIRPRLLRKIESKRDNPQEMAIIKVSRWLLAIVFAKSGQSSMQAFPSTSDPFSGTLSTALTVTFAMRHRALRTASVLCPQEVLERVILDDGYLCSNKKPKGVSLRECAFASFVAKEIEEMGLPLPHPDLERLASMQYPSYARTLWRHHRDCKADRKGRLFLLLVEMSLHGDHRDYSLAENVLREMNQNFIPRSLLLATHHIALHKTQWGISEPLCGTTLHRSIEIAAKAILSEANRLIQTSSSEINPSAQDIISSIRRLSDILINLSDYDEGLRQLQKFIEVLRNMQKCLTARHQKAFRDLNVILASAARRLDAATGYAPAPDSLVQESDGNSSHFSVSDVLRRIET